MVHELTLTLMRNVGPTRGMVGAAHRAEAEAYHINGGAAEAERTVPVELHNPAGFECADGISQKPSALASASEAKAIWLSRNSLRNCVPTIL